MSDKPPSLRQRIVDRLSFFIAWHLPATVVEDAFMRIWTTAIPDPENSDVRDIGEVYLRWIERDL